MQNVKSKLKNFLYYYKWHILIVAFFVTVISIMAVQMATRDEYDIRVLYAGPEILTDAERAEFTDALIQLGQDYDGNGEKKAELFDLIIMDDKQLADAYDAGYNPYYLNATTVKNNRETLTFHAMANEYTLLFLAEEEYALLRNHNMLVPLKNLGYEEELPYCAADEYAVKLSDMPISKFFKVFGDMPDDTVICIKRISESKDGKSKADKQQSDHIELFKTMVEFKLPEDFVAP